jgi:hypothetical protein
MSSVWKSNRIHIKVAEGNILVYDVELLVSIADVNRVSAYRGFLREKVLLLTMKSA